MTHDAYTAEREWVTRNEPTHCLGGKCHQCGDRRALISGPSLGGMIDVTCPTCWHTRRRKALAPFAAKLKAHRAGLTPAGELVQLEMFA